MKFNFIKEQPLQSEDDLKKMQFGHAEIASTLADMSEQCDTPFTIALFGKWGSGKSTISNKVASLLEAKDIPVIVFDVWKHEGDFLRRSFLKECYKQFKSKGKKYFNQDYVLDERVEHGVTRTETGVLKPNREILGQIKKVLWYVIIVVAALSVGASYFGKLAEVWQILTPILTSSLVAAFITNLLGNMLTTEQTTFSSDRLQDPHEFQLEFTRIIKNLKTRRALIVFDNLDRVSHERAVETLSTIKTFLEPTDEELKDHDIVFLIPCDDQAIRHHLRAVYDKNGTNGPFDPDEFLKKFFNTIIWIPVFIPSELVAFARTCLVKTSISALNDPTLAWLITKTYRENPRQIIQFVNILVSNYLLVLSREGEDRDFDSGFAEQNKKEICLYLLLKHVYPELIVKLRELGINSLDKLPDELGGKDQSEKKRISDFKSFVIEVSSVVVIDNLRPFYTLRRSAQEKKFPGIEQLYIYLEDNRIDQAKETADGLKGIGDNVTDFALAITNKLETISNPTAIAYFINSLLHVLEHLKCHLDYAGNSALFNAIKTRASEKLHVILPTVLYGGLITQVPIFTNQIVALWITRLDAIITDESLRKSSRGFISSLFDVFTQHPNIVKSQSQKIKSILATNFADDIEILKKFITSEEIQKQFLSKDYVTAFVDSITDKDVTIYDSEADGKSREPIKLAMLNRFNADFFDDALMKAVVTKLLAQSNAKTAQAWNPEAPEDWESLFLSFKDFVIGYDLSNLSNAPELVQFTDGIIAALNKIPDWDNRRIVMPLISILKSHLPDPKLTELRQIEVQFLTNASLESLDYYLKSLGDNKAHIQESEHLAIFQQRSGTGVEILDYFYPKVITETKSKWLLALLDSNPAEAIRKIVELKYKIPTPDVILNKILQLASPAPAPQKLQYYEIVNAMRCNSDQEIERVFVDQLKSLLTTNEQSGQKVGYDALYHADYLDAYKREITRAILDYLNGLPNAEKYQKYSLETLYTMQDQLTPQEQGTLTQYCFDYLILKSNNVDAIKLGFEFLKVFAPSYEERNLNFTDLKNYIEQQPDSPNKPAIIEGLRILKPDKINKSSKEFWGWVDTLE